MNLVGLLPVGRIEGSLLEHLRLAIPRSLGVECDIVPVAFDPSHAYHVERQQFHSSEILQKIRFVMRPRDWRLLAVADVDLYIPILKYVFGEALLGGPCALISAYRLRQEFYGLDSDEDLLRERLLKEALHELGHTLNLVHCEDYRCAMSSAHGVEWIDLRGGTFCQSCAARAEAKIGSPATSYALANHKSSLP